MKVLVLGSTGGIGRHVVRWLLAEDKYGNQIQEVRTIVRPQSKLPSVIPQEHPKLKVVKANLLDMTVDELAQQIEGCDAVFLCLGHNLTFKGLFWTGMMVTDASQLVCKAIDKLQSPSPIKVIEVNTIGVANPDGGDSKATFQRGAFEKGVLGAIALLPPFHDSIKAASFFHAGIGKNNPRIEWCLVRPDYLVDPEVPPAYVVYPAPANGLFNQVPTTRSNVADFMCKLAVDPTSWTEWKYRMPVITDQTGKQ